MNGQRRLAAITSTLLLLTGLLGVAAPNVATAEEHPPVTLASTSNTWRWSGEFDAGVFGVWPLVSLPEACTPQACDILPLDVRLPERTWQQRPGGLLVAIQVPELGYYDLDLHVYGPDGSRAAGSASGAANEAAWIENPVNGRYTVVVVPRLVASQPLVDDVLEPLEYQGFVKFQRGVTVQREEVNNGEPYTREFVAFGLTERRPTVELLPDLVPTTPRNFHIAVRARGAELPSCLPTETLGLHDDEPDPSDAPLRCLRFDQGEYNYGDGPLQLNVYETEPDVYQVYQRIYSSDGNARQIGPLGGVEFNDAHGHFHYLGFQDVALHRIGADGSLTFVKEKPDKGICMADLDMGRFGRTDQPTSPPGYPVLTGPTCLGFSHQDPNDPTFPNMPYFEMGISVGWADIYPSPYFDQYVDITDRNEVPDGDYALVVRQDVSNRILEKNTRNNTAMGCVRITGDEAEEIACEAEGRQP